MKNTYKLTLLLIVLILSFTALNISCGKSKSKIEKPTNLLDRKTFENTLLDMYLVEGFVRFKIRDTHYDSLRMAAMIEMNALYEKHHTNHEQFTSSYAYYMNNPVVSEEIMKNVINHLVELQAKEETKQRDSVASKTNDKQVTIKNWYTKYKDDILGKDLIIPYVMTN